MSDPRLDDAIIAHLAQEILAENECPCGWSWDLGCQLDCPLNGRQAIRRPPPEGERLKCVFDGSKMTEEERLFLAKTWSAVQLMGLELDE